MYFGNILHHDNISSAIYNESMQEIEIPDIHNTALSLQFEYNCAHWVSDYLCAEEGKAGI
jgi:hypothetical protein